MKDNIELLEGIIANETKFVETMRHSLKEDELTILRLQNKTKALEKEVEERKQLIKEYRGHLVSLARLAHTRMKQMPSIGRQMVTNTSTTPIRLGKGI